jgi:hypothetical protein
MGGLGSSASPDGLGGLGGLGRLGDLGRLGGLGGATGSHGSSGAAGPSGLNGAAGPGGLGGMASMPGLGGLGAMIEPQVDGDSNGAVEIDPARAEEIRNLVACNPTLIRPLVAHIKEREPDADLTEDPESVLRFFSQSADDKGTTRGDQHAPVSMGITPPRPAAPAASAAAAPAAARLVNPSSPLTLAEEASINRVGFLSILITQRHLLTSFCMYIAGGNGPRARYCAASFQFMWQE